MKVFVVNLARDTERMADKSAELGRLGVAFERFEAVSGRDLPSAEKNAAVDRFRWWCARGYRVTDGEIGCALSHHAIYRKTIDEDLPAVCVLEDDVPLADLFPEQLRRVGEWIDPAKPQVVLLTNHTPERCDDWCVRPAAWDCFAEAYVVTQSAARAILAANTPLKAPCDNWHRWVKTGVIELFHAFPTACRHTGMRFGSATVAYPIVERMSPLRRFAHKCVRLVFRPVDDLLLLFERKAR